MSWERKSKGGERRPASSRLIIVAGAFTMALAVLLQEGLFAWRGGDPAAAQSVSEVSESLGDFDYFVLALSWSPAFCAENPDADQCGAGRRFVLHGLWPQNERGYPERCDSRFDGPSRALLRDYTDLTGGRGGLLRHQWRKHGSCAGVSPRDYFELTRAAVDRITIPSALEGARRSVEAPPRVIESAFLEANPDLSRDMITIKCRDNRFSEARICLTRDLEPRVCGDDIVRDCGARRVDLIAPRN